MTVLTYGRNNSSTIKVRGPAVLCTRKAMMRSRLVSCALLQPLIVSILVTITTGELEYYQDIAAEPSEENALKQLARYLESNPQKQYVLYHTRLPPHLKPRTHKEHLFELEREKERNIIDILQKEEMKQLNYQQQARQNFMAEYDKRKEREPAYFDLDPVPNHIKGYPNYKEPLFDDKPKNRNENYEIHEDEVDEEEEEEQVEHGMKEMPFSDFHMKQMESDAKRENQKNMGSAKTTELNPDFTYRFDEPKEQPFAMRPNEPRYYEDRFLTEKQGPNDITERTQVTSAEDSQSNTREMPPRISYDNANGRQNGFEDENAILPEIHRRAEHGPLVSPIDHKVNNDIYFIAIVAGCSAAAMFALMLISLTWCRLQRGAKAAADIEYPAYGITGPNKDTSPSGDQRLAQSAQMYHFQHQKQQIIAMESRSAAVRDPGSVSEAESDEENEEGDYTVYECPGLAPTGEMEVKNPLFHDDPTPATPAQTKQEGDHI